MHLITIQIEIFVEKPVVYTYSITFFFMPTLLYGCETWTVYQRHARTLNWFHLNCLRKMLRIRWLDKIPDTDVLKNQLRWSGHVIRMEDSRIPKQLLLSEQQAGKGSHGVPKKHFKDTLKASLKCFDVDPENKPSSVTLGVQPLLTVHLHMRQSAPFKQSQKDRKESQEL